MPLTSMDLLLFTNVNVEINVNKSEKQAIFLERPLIKNMVFNTNMVLQNRSSKKYYILGG